MSSHQPGIVKNKRKQKAILDKLAKIKEKFLARASRPYRRRWSSDCDDGLFEATKAFDLGNLKQEFEELNARLPDHKRLQEEPDYQKIKKYCENCQKNHFMLPDPVEYCKQCATASGRCPQSSCKCPLNTKVYPVSI